MSYALTNPQKSIWLTEKYHANTSVNNICGYVHIQNKVDFSILEKAIIELVKTNDGIRLQVTEEKGTCTQYVSEFVDFNIEHALFSSKDEIEEKATEMASIPFKIEKSPLFHFLLFELPTGDGGIILNVHHLISDSWSIGLICKEIIHIYSEMIQRTYQANEYPSYLRYIDYEADYMRSDKFQKDQSYWEELFSLVPEVASIPSNQTSTSSFSIHGSRQKFIFSKEEVKQIKDFCNRYHLSIYNFFMAVYSLYIGRVSCLDDFVIGTPILNRTNFEQKNTLGMFVSTAPLKIHLNHAYSFVDFCKEISTNTLSLLKHQKYPYQKLLEDLRKKDSSLPNLYSTVLSYQITKTAEKDCDLDYTTDWIFNGYCADDMQIHLFDFNDDDKITVAYDYKTEKYENEEIINIHHRVLTILHQIFENNQLPLKEIEIVTPEEKHKILYDFNNTNVEYPRDKTIVDLFEEQVKKTPNHIAVVFENQKLTYKELNEKANQLARYLIEYGINPKDTVGLRINKSLEMIVGILAIIKAGACYLPMNMAYPIDRVKYMVQDSNCKVLLSSRVSGNISLNIPIVNIDLDIKSIYQKDCSNISIQISPEDLIYIIYTSGSTGSPKGAMICHRNVVRLMKNKHYLFDFNEEDVWTMFHSVAFDFSVWEMYGALLYGGKLVLISDDTAHDPKLFLKLLRRENVTILNQTPTYFYNLQNEELNYPDHDLKIRYIIFGGEALNPQLLQKWNQKYPNVNLINMYGITETTVHVTFKKLTHDDLLSKSSIVGKPIPTLHVLVLDKYQNLLPFGTEGEMYVLGDGVFKGYLNREKLNREKLLILPKYSSTPIYRSGDSAILHKDGNIEYIGRIDTQVKIRGFRIELGEIENEIITHSNIDKCIVCKKNDPSGRAFLCAYYIKNGSVDISVLRKALAVNLPSYMIPQYFIEINHVPINLNGKTDYKSLPLPKTIEEKEILEPKDTLEKIIYDVYKAILGIKNFSMQNSFFDLGGDSLSAISVSSKLSSVLRKEITVKNILEHPVLVDLAEYIKSIDSLDKTSISSAPKAQFYPLSSAQKRIYYASNLDPNSTLYNIAGGIISNTKLNVKNLEKCFDTLINRHDALRTHFVLTNNEIMQIIDKHIDFSIQTEKSNTDNLNETYKNFVKPFDLAKAPLFRVKLIELKDNRSLLLLDMHHIISDGTSLSILLQELCDLYNESSLSEKEIDYKDFTLWEVQQLQSDSLKKQKEYWLNKYQGEIPLLNMPTNYTRPSVQSFEGSNYHSILSKEVFKKIEKVSRQLGITPYMFLLSCYYILLSKYSSQEDIVIGTPIVGRTRPELSNVLGMFVNTLAMRNNVDSSFSFDKFCQEIKKNCLDSFQNQDYPFDMLVQDLNIKRDPSRNPMFDIMFVFQNNGYPKMHLKNTSVEYFIPDNNVSKFDLTLEIVPFSDEYHLRFEYCTKLFNEDFISRLSLHYAQIIHIVLENTTIPIVDIDMVSDKEKNQILVQFNHTETTYPSHKTIIDLFEEQVEKMPNKTAVVFEDQSLSYQELNEKSNQLARFLLANNVCTGDIVGILLDKSIESIIAILGILKIGATFLPIDIGYPRERIDYMLRDSKANIVLTNQNFIHKVNETVQPLIVEIDSSYFSQYDTYNLDISYPVDNLAYIMYTSGSTGTPKGVMVTHQNIIRLVKNNHFITFDENEHILQTGSIVFDACTFEIWGALLNGFELYIMKKENLLDAYLLEEYIEKNHISTLWLTAPLFNQLSETNPSMFQSVKKLLTGGDVLSPKHIEAVQNACPNLTIINGYGPTENTTFSCCFTIDKTYTNSIPIGKPISNSTAYIVSPRGYLCPIGIPGELWVGGDGVSKGYLNNITLTNEKFIKNPFGNGMVYKTGDLVKWLPDGNIEFIGRIDHQIKLRGFRIELAEINTQILKNPYVKEAFTTIQLRNQKKYICSYIVTKNSFDITKLKHNLRTYLPDYMIPSYFIPLEKLPINQNGKVDKSALPIDFDNLDDSHFIKSASTDEEKTLLALFKKVLNKEDIGVADNFFEMGGDSLTAMKLQVEAMSQHLDIAYADIFQLGTVENLIQNLHQQKTAARYYDSSYDLYNELLSNNTLAVQPLECISNDVGNVLLTGSTGFLGAHILDSFLKKENGKIYCLIRSKNSMSARERLFNILHFYFESKYDMLVDDRIILVEGDITFDSFGLSKREYQKLGKEINTVIHSAALVKHYGNYKNFEEINVLGTQRIISFAEAFHLKLFHVSTISVSGNNLAEGSNIHNYFGKEVDFAENNFYIGQNLDNFYVKSKFEAEKLVLDAIRNGLQACILRMGNLTSRFSEGKFQQNHFENAFVNRLKSFLQIGAFPSSLLNLYCEFTPIDYCGDAIMNIAHYFNPKYTVFHLLNEKHVSLHRLIDMLHEMGINIKLVSDKEFALAIQSILNDSEKRQMIQGIVNDLTADKKLVYQSEVSIKSDFTKEFLYQTGFEWPYIDIHYIRNYFQYLTDIGYFNIKLN